MSTSVFLCTGLPASMHGWFLRSGTCVCSLEITYWWLTFLNLHISFASQVSWCGPSSNIISAQLGDMSVQEQKQEQSVCDSFYR